MMKFALISTSPILISTSRVLGARGIRTTGTKMRHHCGVVSQSNKPLNDSFSQVVATLTVFSSRAICVTMIKMSRPLVGYSSN
ncbi:hypothetical protein V8C35DRAFT_309544 [Trichoderma chlorosporum]